MSEPSGVTVAELVALLRDRGKRVPSELGAFITLQAVERIIDRPAPLAAEIVRVTDDGIVSVHAAPGAAGEADVTRGAQALLAHLLVGAGAAVPRPLLDLVERGPSDGSGTLGRFRDELEASLLPLNRGASQRVLARLVRESRAGGGASSKPPMVDVEELDADLDALLGGESPAPMSVAAQSPIEARIPSPTATPTPIPSSISTPTPTPTPTPTSPTAGPTPMPIARPTVTAVPTPLAIDHEPPLRRIALDDDYAIERPRGSRQSLLLASLFVSLVLGTAALVYAVRPDVLERMMGDAPPEPDHAAEEVAHRAEAERRATAAAARYGDLVIHVPHDRAQVLMRVGRGPAVATNLPLGIAHEFVAIAGGRVPTRAVVPPDATWEPTNEGPRYELAMQAGEAEMPFEALDLGETRLPRDVGANRNQLGSVRVLTNPPGAEVFLLIGFAPDARVRDLRADQTYELVVWAEGFAPKRVIVRPEDFHDAAEGRAANVEVRLDARRAAARR